MRKVQSGPLVGLAMQVAVLAGVWLAVGLPRAGWVAGLACGVTTATLLWRALAARGRSSLGPADWVTLMRTTLIGGVTALVASSFTGTASVAALVVLAGAALALDGVDGYVARRTGTSSELGARFDMEADAVLILVLSVYVSTLLGWWVLAIGLARYVYVAAGWLLPWLRDPVPYRYWRKVVAAVQGVTLTVVASGLLPTGLATAAVLVALALLAESFGRDVLWLWDVRSPRGARPHPVRARVADLAAIVVLWLALVVPNDIDGLNWLSLVRIPAEGIAIVALGAVLPRRPRRIAGSVVGLLLGVLCIMKVLDMGFLVAFGRVSDPVSDWAYFGSAVDLLSLSIGRSAAITALAVAGIAIVALLVGVPWAVLRVMHLSHAHRRGAARAAVALGVAWLAGLTLQSWLLPSAAFASDATGRLLVEHVVQVVDGVHDEQAFAEAAAVDPLHRVPDDQLFTSLRGKDVIVAFVESYGRVALEDPAIAPGVTAVLDDGTRRLAAAGFDARSAFLTSPTFGGISWLAHSTLQSGLWVDSQRRYDELLGTNRTTLSAAFKRAGWRTVSDVPSDEEDWADGRRFYGYDAMYDAHSVGYHGPRFGYASMPDQYVLDAFRGRELQPGHAPVMAEIDLVSSHTPWTPLPRMVPWDALGDGSVFDTMPEQGVSRDVLWRDADQVRAAYGDSIEYTLSALISFVETHPDPNLVLVILGDHQPARIVSGADAGHDVPITILAHDPGVLSRIDGWHWQAGLRPAANAPVTSMDAFRDQFIAAFSDAAQP